MAGATDVTVIQRCRDENRALVTLDLDFANPLVFDPQRYAGVAVLRLPHRPSPQDLFDVVETLVGALESRVITGKLWIVERARIREYQPFDPEPP